MPDIPDSVEIPVNRRSVLAALATGFFVYQGGEKTFDDIGAALDGTPDEFRDSEKGLRDDLTGLRYPSGIDGSAADIEYRDIPDTDQYTYTVDIEVEADIAICQYGSAGQLVDERDELDTAAHEALGYAARNFAGESLETHRDEPRIGGYRFIVDGADHGELEYRLSPEEALDIYRPDGGQDSWQAFQEYLGDKNRQIDC